MEDRKTGHGPLDYFDAQDGATESFEPNLESEKSSAALVRAARAKVIEETAYRLTDLFTIISGKIEILGEKIGGAHREELLTIRSVVLRGVELNKHLFLAVQACRREIGL